ncbi:MAG: PmoA family protein, partial [Verrucomicrobiales bacterium]|nr:PmoA family protein [Verrucomicrobiales bacterium]
MEILPDYDMKRLYFFWIISALALGNATVEAQIGNSAGGWTITSTDPVMIQFKGRLVATYNPGVEEAKPFFYPLYGPGGANMTRHYPQTKVQPGEQDDHVHHRGMWYGLGNVNGLDFWHFPGSKKDKKFGRIVHKGVNKTSMSGNKITIGTKSDWVNDETNDVVCQDTREFTFSHDAGGALILDTKITLIASQGDVTIRDDKEGAWSIRVPPTMRLEGEVAKG